MSFQKLQELHDTGLVNLKSTPFQIGNVRFKLIRASPSKKNRDGKRVFTDDYNHMTEPEVWHNLRRGHHFVFLESGELISESYGVFKFVERPMPMSIDEPVTQVKGKDDDPKAKHLLALEPETSSDSLIVYLTEKANGEFCKVSMFEYQDQVYLEVTSKNRPIIVRLTDWEADIQTFPGSNLELHTERMLQTFMFYFEKMTDELKQEVTEFFCSTGYAMCCEHLDEMHQHVVPPQMLEHEQGNHFRVFAITSPDISRGIMALSPLEAKDLVSSWGFTFVELDRYDLSVSDEFDDFCNKAEEKRCQENSEGTVFTVATVLANGQEFMMYQGKDKNYWYIVARTFRQKILAMSPIFKWRLGQYQQQAFNRVSDKINQEWFVAFFGYLLKWYGEISQELKPLGQGKQYEKTLQHFQKTGQINKKSWEELIYAFYVTLMDRFNTVPEAEHGDYIQFAEEWSKVKSGDYSDMYPGTTGMFDENTIQTKIIAFGFAGPGSGKSFLAQQLNTVLADDERYLPLLLSSDDWKRIGKSYNKIFSQLSQGQIDSKAVLKKFGKQCPPLKEAIEALLEIPSDKRPTLVAIRDKCTPDLKHLPRGTGVLVLYDRPTPMSVLGSISQAKLRETHPGGLDQNTEMSQLIKVICSFNRESAKNYRETVAGYEIVPFPGLTFEYSSTDEVTTAINAMLQDPQGPSFGDPLAQDILDAAQVIQPWLEDNSLTLATTDLVPTVNKIIEALDVEVEPPKPAVVYWSLKISGLPENLKLIRDDALTHFGLTPDDVTIKEEFHITLVFRPTDEESEQLWPLKGQEFQLQLVGVAADPTAVCVAVQFPNNVPPVLRLDKGCKPHITLAFKKAAKDAGKVAGKVQNFEEVPDELFWVPCQADESMVVATLEPYIRGKQ